MKHDDKNISKNNDKTTNFSVFVEMRQVDTVPSNLAPAQWWCNFFHTRQN